MSKKREIMKWNSRLRSRSSCHLHHFITRSYNKTYVSF